ncbi:MAG: hypothetical protein HY815_28370 [Candidatus Riflebacteria bacterium]|nr:hypothetical protein [Candidatus Riflebacteria bacterium]
MTRWMIMSALVLVMALATTEQAQAKNHRYGRGGYYGRAALVHYAPAHRYGRRIVWHTSFRPSYRMAFAGYRGRYAGLYSGRSRGGGWGGYRSSFRNNYRGYRSSGRGSRGRRY